MFVYTLKWNRKTAVFIILAAAFVLCAIVLIIGLGGDDAPTCKVRNNEERVEFLESLGWQVHEEVLSERQIVIPQDFSSIYTAYNELQLAQGYDLSQFSGMEATVFTYAVENYSGYTGNVVADLYVCDEDVIGGDVHSLELDGFMHGLTAANGSD